jgi:hypothetical protein
MYRRRRQIDICGDSVDGSLSVALKDCQNLAVGLVDFVVVHSMMVSLPMDTPSR